MEYVTNTILVNTHAFNGIIGYVTGNILTTKYGIFYEVIIPPIPAPLYLRKEEFTYEADGI